MKKSILLSNGSTVTYDSITNEGYETVLSFYEPKISKLVSNWNNVPYHDKEDLSQVCRMKLLEAMKSFNPKRNVNFSTYVYTIWNRKIFQITTKYKAKKYTTYTKNDHHVNLNHKYDKISTGQYLRTNCDKCPLKNRMITTQMCSGCDFHVRYEKRLMQKGGNAGKSKNFTICTYYKQIIEKRKTISKSLDAKIPNSKSSDTNLLSYVVCEKQKRHREDEEFKMEFVNLKSHLKTQYFQILELILDGYNNSEIIKKLKITNIKLVNSLKTISKNEKVKELLMKNK